MPDQKTIKKIILEAFQWCAFATPVFVTGQTLASKECLIKNGTADCSNESGNQKYWLFITAIIAYVTGITLLVWIPLKLLVAWKKIIRPYEGLWFPGNVLYLVFSCIPCLVFTLIGHENCSTSADYCFNYFRGAPIETFIIMMVVTDWSEKIRYMKLRSSDDSVKTKKYGFDSWRDSKTSGDIGNGDIVASESRRSSRHTLIQSRRRHGKLHQRIARFLKWTDGRPENLLRDLMLAYDTRLLLGLTLLTDDEKGVIFKTDWVYPIYILSWISLMPLILSPNSQMRSSTSVFLQDVPFFILRLAILGTLKSDVVLQTSILFLLKNFFNTISFFYFNVVLPWRIISKASQEYELEQVTPDYSNGGTVTNRQSSMMRSMPDHNMSRENGEVALHNGNSHQQSNGISNPAYSSKRYDATRANGFRPPQHSLNYAEQDQNLSGRDYFDEQLDSDDDELYPSPRRLEPSPPQVARVISHSYEEHPTYHPQPEVTSEPILQRVEDRPQPVAIVPIKQASNKPREINYDTLNDPNSFLYSNAARQERRPVKPAVADIDFGSTDPKQTQNSLPESNNEDLPNVSRIAAADHSLHTQPTSESSLQAPEPTYAQVDRSTRRKAPPPPPTSSRPKPEQKITENSPQPAPQEIIKEVSDASGKIPTQDKPIRQDSLYTPALARTLADEARRRQGGSGEEKEAMEAMDDALDHISKMINSNSTTPKSTYSEANVIDRPPLNEEDFDIKF